MWSGDFWVDSDTQRPTQKKTLVLVKGASHYKRRVHIKKMWSIWSGDFWVDSDTQRPTKIKL